MKLVNISYVIKRNYYRPMDSLSVVVVVLENKEVIVLDNEELSNDYKEWELDKPELWDSITGGKYKTILNTDSEGKERLIGFLKLDWYKKIMGGTVLWD